VIQGLSERIIVEEQNMGELHTDPKLLTALTEAAKRPLTPQQVHLQKVSFIMGSLAEDSTITRARIEEVLRKLEGLPA
jgi:molecular chaperone DnaK (HSP70)